jgi:hypothetical protein
VRADTLAHIIIYVGRQASLFCSEMALYLLRLQENERRLGKAFPAQRFILSFPDLSRKMGAKITYITCHNFRKENVSFKSFPVYVFFSNHMILFINQTNLVLK